MGFRYKEATERRKPYKYTLNYCFFFVLIFATRRKLFNGILGLQFFSKAYNFIDTE